MTTDQEVMGSTLSGALIIREVAQLGRALGLGPGVAGSNPVFPIYCNIMGLSSAGRAPALHAGGQRFDPASLHHIIYKLYKAV